MLSSVPEVRHITAMAILVKTPFQIGIYHLKRSHQPKPINTLPQCLGMFP